MGLSLKLLGDFEVGDEAGKPLSLPTRKTRALLAYLAVNADSPQQRERLMALLWSDRGEQQARHSLNQALMSIRKLGDYAGATLLDGNGERVALLGDAVESDIAKFQGLLADDPAAAVALYEGPFLDGLTIPDPAFEEWLAATRADLHNRACDALVNAAERATGDADRTTAINLTRRLVAFDPLREDGHRRLMTLLRESGDRAGALRQYQVCADILKKELQVEPDTVTRTLFEEIRGDAPLKTAAERVASFVRPDRAPSLPDKPSIAVLPFGSMSDDRELEFLADSFTEDITLLLARIPGFFVISGNSAIVYKGKAPDIRDVARELGVRYVVIGSLRPLGSQLRITAQLLEASTGAHIWANRFDRPIGAIYDVQDEVVTGIMAQHEPELTRAEFETSRRRPHGDMNAWTYYQRAHGLLSLKGWRRETFAEAAELLNQAIDLDPDFALAHAYLALIRAIGHQFGLSPDGEYEDNLVVAEVEVAMDLDNHDSTVLGFAGCALCDIGQTGRGVVILERAVEQNPSNAQAWVALGVALMGQGKVRRGIEMLRHGIRISPLDSRSAYWGTNLANAFFRIGRVEEALEEATLACRRDEKLYMARVVRAMILHYLGRDHEAKQAMTEAYRINEDLQLDQIRVIIGRRGVEILRNAGLLIQ